MLDDIRKLERLLEPGQEGYLQAVRERLRIDPIKGKVSLGEDSYSCLGEPYLDVFDGFGDGIEPLDDLKTEGDGTGIEENMHLRLNLKRYPGDGLGIDMEIGSQDGDGIGDGIGDGNGDAGDEPLFEEGCDEDSFY